MDSQHLGQSVQNSTFHLFNRSMHPELFELSQSRRFFQHHYEVHLWITGCSHVVSVFAHGYCMTEVICSPGQLLPKRGLIEQFALKGNKRYQCTWPNGMVYLLNTEIETVGEEVYRQFHGNVLQASEERGLFAEFRDQEADHGVPFCYLDFETHKDELHLFAYHGLPEQQLIIKTQSLFNTKDRKRNRRRQKQ